MAGDSLNNGWKPNTRVSNTEISGAPPKKSGGSAFLGPHDDFIVFVPERIESKYRLCEYDHIHSLIHLFNHSITQSLQATASFVASVVFHVSNALVASASLPLISPACAPPSSCPPTMTILARSVDSVRGYLGSCTWGPFVNLSRSAVLSLFQKIEAGQLVITDTDGTVTVCGRAGVKDGAPRTELLVSKEAFWVRVLLFADMVRRRGNVDKQ